MPDSSSRLYDARLKYQPKLPAILSHAPTRIAVAKGASTESVADRDAIRAMFPTTYGQPEVTFQPGGGALDINPLSVGVVLSGGQAPGGHNVISGLFDSLKTMNPASRLYGFLGGPSGLTDDKVVEITSQMVDA